MGGVGVRIWWEGLKHRAKGVFVRLPIPSFYPAPGVAPIFQRDHWRPWQMWPCHLIPSQKDRDPRAHPPEPGSPGPWWGNGSLGPCRPDCFCSTVCGFSQRSNQC